MYYSKSIRFKDKRGQLIERRLIAYGDRKLENNYSIMNKFCNVYTAHQRSYAYAGKEIVGKCAQFCEYLSDVKGLNVETDYTEITFEDAQDFLNFYCTSPKRNTSDEPGFQSRKEALRAVSCLLEGLKQHGYGKDLDKHYITAEKESSRGKKYELYIYSYRDETETQTKVIRDVPEFFVKKMVEMAWKYDIDTWMLMQLQIYAGLRPSEACNVRSAESSYGSGIKTIFGYEDIPISMRIDISKEARLRPLRSDYTQIGSIKKPREVTVYGGYVPLLYDAYINYIKATKDRKKEEYGPLVTNRYQKEGYHMAMSYDNYRKRFKSLATKLVIPYLVNCGGEKKIYAEKLMGGKFGPHMLREYFTCRLFEANLNWSDIMYYRGDKSAETAVLYLLKGGTFKRLSISEGGVLGEEILDFNKGITENDK